MRVQKLLRVEEACSQGTLSSAEKSALREEDANKRLAMANAGAVDVAIAGGGLVGAALACMLATRARAVGYKLKIALVERRPPDIDDADAPALAKDAPQWPSLRTSTISPASVRALEQCGVWKFVPSARCASVAHMRVWEEPPKAAVVSHEGEIVFDAERDVGERRLAVLLENDVLRCAMYRRLAEVGDAVHIVRGEVSRLDLSQDASKWPSIAIRAAKSLSGAEEQSVSARVLVATDGRNSRIRADAGFSWFSHEYEQRAVVANVESRASLETSRTAYQRFLSTGPVALLPVATSRGTTVHNVVWSTTPAEAEALTACEPSDFVRELNHALEYRGAPAVVVQSLLREREHDGHGRASFPLVLGHAPTYVRGRIVLMGDAAHAVHPLAGQGVNLGLADALALSERAGVALASGRDLGGDDGAMLLAYQAARLPANASAMAAIHALKTAFDAQWAPLASARAATLSFLSTYAPPVKRALIRAAMGDIV